MEICRNYRKYFLVLLSLLIIITSACQPKIPANLLKPSETSLQERNMQTRKYDTLDDKRILVAASQTLQDLGFSLDESETKLGVIVASKNADAKDKNQYAMAVTLSMLDALSGQYSDHFSHLDHNQKIRASVVTYRPANSKATTIVRITFQRMIWNTAGQLSKQETLVDKQLYAKFFQSLSKAIFLEGHEL